MAELQELISRGRLLFVGAPKRLEVFKLVNGRRTGKEIAKATGKPISSTLHDLQKMRDMELIKSKQNAIGESIKKNDSTIYEKVPLLQHISLGYFSKPEKLPKTVNIKRAKHSHANRVFTPISMPSEKDILDICKNGEDQLYEFKAAGIETNKLAKEVCAFANTKSGGLIFYGVEDDGVISGTDKSRQKFDQSLQNSIKNTISPSLVVSLSQKNVLGNSILIVRIPPWNKDDVYHFEGRVLIRKGTNVFVATPGESKQLHAGKYVI
ncbi:MAG: ATP-binding protein [Candidatus Micrarchaeota archaeon]|nr:ATP-binding protein [Candidatus Micrarchaeota archaeon]